MSYQITVSVKGTAVPPAQTRESMRRAEALFWQFHCFPPRRLIRLPQRREIPEVLAHVGELCGLIYRSDRGQRGQPCTFVHFFKLRPQLTCDGHGKHLYIVGGNYCVTSRGIEG